LIVLSLANSRGTFLFIVTVYE